MSFIGLGYAILRRPALHDVGDVHLLAAQSHGGNHVVEQLSGFAYERHALRIFVCAGTLAYEHEPGIRIAIPKNDLVPPRCERTPGTVPDIFANQLQGRSACCRRDYGSNRRCRRKGLSRSYGGVLIRICDSYIDFRRREGRLRRRGRDGSQNGSQLFRLGLGLAATIKIVDAQIAKVLQARGNRVLNRGFERHLLLSRPRDGGGDNSLTHH